MDALKSLFDAIAESFMENMQITAQKYNLDGSALVKNTKIHIDVKSGSVTISAPDYFTFVENGVKKGALKGVYVPISVLLKWMKKKNIAPGRENEVVWAIRYKIHAVGINGYPGRPYASEALDMTLNDSKLNIKFDNFISEKLNLILK